MEMEIKCVMLWRVAKTLAPKDQYIVVLVVVNKAKAVANSWEFSC